MKSFSLKSQAVQRKWRLIDASNRSPGRVATEAASLLIGKDKASYTPHVDGGDFVIIINAAKLKVTGEKASQKLYYRHSGFPGGLSAKRLSEVQANEPETVLEKAIRGMLPVNKLRASRLKRLKIYVGEEHRHQAQQPISQGDE